MLEQNKHGIWTPRNVCAFGLGLDLSLGAQQPAPAAGGGGGGDYTNIAFTMVLDPANDTDNMFRDTSGAVPIVPATDGDTVRRWDPATWPVEGYMEDTSAVYPLWRTPGNGINDIGVIEMQTNAEYRMWQGGAFTSANVFNADSMVFGWAGKRIATYGGGSNNVLRQNNPATDEFVINSETDGTFDIIMHMATAQTQTITVTPDGSSLFAVVIWLHDNVIDYWLDGVKQTQITGVNDFAQLTGAFWRHLCINGNSYQLMKMVFAASHDNEDDVANLAAHLETLLGR